MKRIKILLTALLIVTAAFTYAQTAVTRSSVTYQVKNLGITTGGKFGGFQADIRFDPAQLTNSTIEASIDVNTVDSDNSTRDGHLKSAKFFDAEHYPRILLKSLSFQRKSGNNYTGKFNLTIKGITKQVDVPFTYTAGNGKAGYNGSFIINRKDFNVGGSSLVLANEVTVFIMAETGIVPSK
ncbi:MAG: YceI family protein [Mucilaginibacter sp.]